MKGLGPFPIVRFDGGYAVTLIAAIVTEVGQILKSVDLRGVEPLTPN